METAQFRDVVTVNLVNHSFFLHLQQFPVDGANQVLVDADVAVFTRCQCQVIGRQVVQLLMVDMVVGLIAEADDCIVTTAAQVFQGFGQVAHHVEYGTGLGKRVGNGTTGHIGNILAF